MTVLTIVVGIFTIACFTLSTWLGIHPCNCDHCQCDCAKCSDS